MALPRNVSDTDWNNGHGNEVMSSLAKLAFENPRVKNLGDFISSAAKPTSMGVDEGIDIGTKVFELEMRLWRLS